MFLKINFIVYVHHSQQEFSTTGINSAKAIEIPSKPKRPLTAFFRTIKLYFLSIQIVQRTHFPFFTDYVYFYIYFQGFVQENRSSVVPPEGIKTPARYVTEHLAVKWRDVSTETKLRFKNLYEKEKVREREREQRSYIYLLQLC